MPSIGNVDLTMSRDTDGVVTARVDFELQFSQFEIAANVSITERVVLERRMGDLDRWELGAAGAVQSQAGGGDSADTTIAVLSSSDVDAASLGLSGAGVSVTRSFTHVLTSRERQSLLEFGRDHPYAVVSVVPKEVSADLKLAAVELLDVGDPEIVTTVDVGGEPTALAADGQDRFYVATTEGEVVVFDRVGNQQARFAVGGRLSGLTYDGSMFWAAVADGDVIKPFDNTGTVGTPRATGGSEPVAVVATGSSVWIANAASQTVTQTTAGGVVSTTPVPGTPVAIAPCAARFSPNPNFSVVMVAVANPEGVAVSSLQAIDAGGEVVNTQPLTGPSPPPRAIAIIDPDPESPSAVRLPLYTTEAGVHLLTGVDKVALLPSRGVAVGAGAFWVAVEPDQLAKFLVESALLQGSLEQVSSYPVGNGADAVLFDTDRVYVANRVGRSVSIVLI